VVPTTGSVPPRSHKVNQGHSVATNVTRSSKVIHFHQGHTRSTKVIQFHQDCTRSFKVIQCHQGHTSLEMITSRDSGLILYFCPLSDSPDNIREDFLLLELRGGYPVLRVNQGSGEARLAVDGRDRQGRLRVGKLSDGEWHRLDIFITGQVFCAHSVRCITCWYLYQCSGISFIILLTVHCSVIIIFSHHRLVAKLRNTRQNKENNS